MLLQVSSQLQDGHADLIRLHESYKAGTPPSPVLTEYLRRLIQRFHQVYVLLDALDESSRNGPRRDVLNVLETIRNWGLQGLHLLFTSQDERDIHESFDQSNAQQIIMQNTGIDKDIADFISSRLNTDLHLQKWRKHREKIQEALTGRAKGVYVETNYETAAVLQEYRLISPTGSDGLNPN